MLKRIVTLLVAFPMAALMIALSIANRHTVELVLDPFRPEAPALAIALPFYMHLLGALIAGVMLGGIATWASQRRYRRQARQRDAEARRWHAEADRLVRERDASVAARGRPVALPRAQDAA